MEDIPETYNLETIEQVRSIADTLRLRIIERLALQAMTVTQLAGVLGEVPAKLHYHVRELEKVGLLKLVETREKGGILEKYYRSVAKSMHVPGGLFQGVPPDEIEGMITEVIQPFFQGVTQTAQYMLHHQLFDNPDHALIFMTEQYWMTADELRQVDKQIDALLRPYKEPRGIEHEHEHSTLWVGYTVTPPASKEAETSLPAAAATPPAAALATAGPAKAPKRELTWVAGIAHYGRKELEEVIEKGARLDFYLFGACSFADDVTPDLIERAIYRFHLWGKLTASPEVREALKRKGGETTTKSSTPA